MKPGFLPLLALVCSLSSCVPGGGGGSTTVSAPHRLGPDGRPLPSYSYSTPSYGGYAGYRTPSYGTTSYGSSNSNLYGSSYGTRSTPFKPSTPFTPFTQTPTLRKIDARGFRDPLFRNPPAPDYYGPGTPTYHSHGVTYTDGPSGLTSVDRYGNRSSYGHDLYGNPTIRTNSGPTYSVTRNMAGGYTASDTSGHYYNIQKDMGGGYRATDNNGRTYHTSNQYAIPGSNHQW